MLGDGFEGDYLEETKMSCQLRRKKRRLDSVGTLRATSGSKMPQALKGS